MEPASAQPRSWLSVLLSLCLRGLGRGLGCALWGIVLFSCAAWIFYRALLVVPGGPPLVALPILLLAYIVLGFVCGTTIGVTAAVMEHTRELAAALYKPLERIAFSHWPSGQQDAIVWKRPVDGISNSWGREMTWRAAAKSGVNRSLWESACSRQGGGILRAVKYMASSAQIDPSRGVTRLTT